MYMHNDQYDFCAYSAGSGDVATTCFAVALPYLILHVTWYSAICLLSSQALCSGTGVIFSLIPDEF